MEQNEINESRSTIEGQVKRVHRRGKGITWSFLFIGVVLLGLFSVFGASQGNMEISIPKDDISVDSSLLENKKIVARLNGLRKEIGQLERKLNGFLPKAAYIVVNTTENRFRLYDRNGELVRDGFCSSGSYTKLVLNDKKSWIFKTPKGRMVVLSKTVNPVWAKPDWAFIEEGLPVPKPGDPSRFERGVLGDYALRMADGYLIHGTLYKRFLGMPVTHGCIRMGDEDLEVVYKTLNPGSYVYIY